MTKQVSTEPGRVSKCRHAHHQQQHLAPRPADGTGGAPAQLPRLQAVAPAARTGPAAATALPAGGVRHTHVPGHSTAPQPRPDRPFPPRLSGWF